VQLTIEKLIYGGDGLARLPADSHGRGKAVFVPFVLEGEKVEATLVEERPGFVRARMENILEPSPKRTAAPCPYFQRCGGCHYQHTGYDQQLLIKASILKENLRRIAKVELEHELQVHPSPPLNYRNRARLKVQVAPKFTLGYYKFGSHELLPVDRCPISSPLINRAITALGQPDQEGKLPDGLREIEFFASADDSELLIELYFTPGIRRSDAIACAEHVQRHVPHTTGVAAFEGKDTATAGAPALKKIAVAGVPELRYRLQDGSYRVSAGAFFQVNRHLADALVRIALGGASGALALDLYAGVGLFSTILARSFAQVIAVEASPTAHADLTYNAPANVTPVLAVTDQYLKNAANLPHPDFVLVDPPRNGLGKQVVRGLLATRTPRITYVSCDPATLARDLVDLLGGGFRVEQAHLVDLFPQTYHLESVFQLVR